MVLTLTTEMLTLQARLNDMQVKVGEVERSMNDVIATLDQLDSDIKNQGDVSGDPKHLETILRKLQVGLDGILCCVCKLDGKCQVILDSCVINTQNRKKRFCTACVHS